MAPQKRRVPSGKGSSFPDQANLDHPYRLYETTGRESYARLADRKQKGKGRKLSAYEEYLLTKHFPAQEKSFLAQQKIACAKRKGARRDANRNVGLVEENAEEDKDASDRIFQANHRPRYC